MTTPTREAAQLLAAILANPDEDTPRLAYADEIEGDDPDRAEFIRVQCELSALPDQPEHDAAACCVIGCDACVELASRRAKAVRMRRLLTEGNYERWIPLFGVDVGGSNGRIHGEFTRGFVSTLRLPLGMLLEHAAALFRAHPITRVVPTDREPVAWGSGRYFWGHEGNRGNTADPEESLIPVDLFWRLKGHYLDDPDAKLRWRRYDTAHEAVADLSALLVEHGRELAGL